MMRNFLMNMPNTTNQLVVVHSWTSGMQPFIVDRSIKEAYVNIREFDYYVTIELFLVGYAGYAAAAAYLELPVISNYRYDEYVELLIPEIAQATALKGAITDPWLNFIEDLVVTLDDKYPDAFEDYIDDDMIRKEVMSLKKAIIRMGDSNLMTMGLNVFNDPTQYTIFKHAALKLLSVVAPY